MTKLRAVRYRSRPKSPDVAAVRRLVSSSGGVFQRGDTWLVCSRGIGMERSHAPRVRFWCRPQLVLLELGGG